MGLFSRKKKSDSIDFAPPNSIDSVTSTNPKNLISYPEDWAKGLLGIHVEKQPAVSLPNTVFQSDPQPPLPPPQFISIPPMAPTPPLPIQTTPVPPPLPKQLPPIAPEPVPKPPEPAPPRKIEDDFELPDFDDNEIEKLEALEREAAQLTTWDFDPVEEAPPAPPPPKIEITMPPPPAIILPEPIEVKAPVQLAKLGPRLEKFIALQEFFSLKEQLAQARIAARDIEENMFDEAYKPKAETYKDALQAFNIIQDKLMLIDTKLYEQEDKPEVRE